MRQFTSDEIRDFVSMPRFDQQKLLCKEESWPKISIVTPSYNQGQFLERTILSVLNQNYPNLEYIIMDGGSTDGSVEIVRKYERYLAHWTSGRDEGQADAIRKGFRLCTGRVFAYLNSDDVYLPGALHQVGRVFQVKQGVDVVYGNKYLTDEKDDIIGERRFTPYVPIISRAGFIYGGFGISQPASFWTRKLYDEVGEVDPAFIHCMDTDLFVRFAVRSAGFRFLREYLSGARIHRESKTSTLRSVAKAEGRVIRMKYRRRKSRLFAFFCLTCVRAVRLAGHLLQGDAIYLFKRKFAGNVTWVP